MKLICNYDTLISNVVEVATVTDDSLLKDDAKNIIFQFRGTQVTLLGIAPQTITLKRTLPVEGYHVEFAEGEDTTNPLYFQLRSKELISFLNTYKSTRRTQAQEVTLELNAQGAVRCTVLEVDKDDESKHHLSYWSFVNYPIKPNQLKEVNIDAPQVQLQVIDPRVINLYTKNLFPVMQAGVSLYSNLVFGEDYVVAFDAAFTVLMANQDEFKSVFGGVRLGYRSVAFIDKIIAPCDDIRACRTDRHIYICTPNSEVFISYDAKLPDYTAYASIYKKDHAIVLDRVYIKDIIKRLSLVNENIEVIVNPETNMVTLRNSKFSQDIEIMQTKAMSELGVLRFKIAPDKLNAGIIGNDADFPSDVRMYFVEQGNKVAVIFTDSTGAWFTVVRVNTY